MSRNLLLWSGPCSLDLDRSYYKDLYLYRSIRKSPRGTWSIKLQDPCAGRGLRAKSTIVRFGQDPETLDLRNDVAYVKLLKRGSDKVLMIQEKCPRNVAPKGCLMFISAEINLGYVAGMGGEMYIDLSSGGHVDGIMTSLAVITEKPTIVWMTVLDVPTPGTVMSSFQFNGSRYTQTSKPFRSQHGERMVQLPIINGMDWSIKPAPRAVEVHRKHKVYFVDTGRYAIRLRHLGVDLIGKEIEVT